jgi:hypothetical protein
MGQGGSTIGKKIEGAFSNLGKKTEDGWNTVKAFGKKTWEDIGKVPVLGDIARFVEKSPLGTIAKGIGTGLDSAVGSGAKILQGDLKGGISKLTEGGRSIINTVNNDPLYSTVKKIPVIGNAISNAPIFGGMSMNNISNIGNAALNGVDALKDGNVKGALTNALNVGQELGSRGVGGDRLKNIVNIGTKINSGIDTAQKVLGK